MRLSTIEVLRAINDGGAIEDLNQQIEAATAVVSDRGGTAKVKLELTITRNGDRQVHVVDAVSSTLPKKKNPVTSFFVTRDGGLSRRDEEQMTLGEETNAR